MLGQNWHSFTDPYILSGIEVYEGILQLSLTAIPQVSATALSFSAVKKKSPWKSSCGRVIDEETES